MRRFSSIRSRGCCRPSAWASPICAPSARRQHDAPLSATLDEPPPGSPPLPPRNRAEVTAQGIATRHRDPRRTWLRYDGSAPVAPVPLRPGVRPWLALRGRPSGALRLHLARTRRSVRHAGRRGGRRWATCPKTRPAVPAASPVDHGDRLYSGRRAWHEVPLYRRHPWRRRPSDRRTRRHPEATAPPSSNRVGRPRSTAQGNLILRRRTIAARPAAGTKRRSGAAGGVQQPLHVGRRPDGR
jgi:hypothetical protein